jgi:hypothetical protein
MLDATVSGTAFVVTNLTNGTLYQFFVRAITASGVSQDATLNTMPFRAVCAAANGVSQIAVFNGETRKINTLVKPLRAFGSRTMLAPLAVDADFAHGEVFSVNSSLNSVSTFPATARGNVAPSRMMSNSQEYHYGVTYDAAEDRLLVVSATQVKAYDRTATSMDAPARTLTVSDGFTNAIGNVVLAGSAGGDRMFAVSLNDERTVYVFQRTDSDVTPGVGIVASRAVITMPGFFSLRAITYDPVTDEILIGVLADSSAVVATPQLLAIPASSNGAAAATRNLTGPDTGLALGDFPGALALDVSRRILYVSDNKGRIFAFDADFGVDADLAPLSVLAGPETGVGPNVQSLAVDQATGNLVVQSGDSILFFPSLPSGDQAPTASIGSESTGVEGPGGLAFAPAQQELFVANLGFFPNVATFNDQANGANVTPQRSLTTPGGGFSFAPPSVAYSPRRDELVYAPGASAAIVIYPRVAAGDAAPSRTIAGVGTGLRGVASIAVDETNDTVFAADPDGTVRRYALSFTDGNEAPLSSIDTGSQVLGGLAVDNANGELLVANETGIVAYHLADDGAATPIRSLNLPNRGAQQVLVDPVADELYVLDDFSQVIEVYPRTGSGNALPLRQIAAFSFAFQTTFSSMTFCN